MDVGNELEKDNLQFNPDSLPAKGIHSRDPRFSRRDFLTLVGLTSLSVGLGIPDLGRFQRSENVNLSFFFVDHVQAKDLNGFDEALKRCDVFIPEWLEWTAADEKYFNDVSQGLASSTQYPYGNEFFTGLLNKIRGSKKTIRILDIPYGHPLDIEFNSIESVRTDYNQSFSDRLKAVATKLEKEADWQRRREEYILSQLSKLPTELRRSDPLKYAGQIKILMDYGASHTRLLHLTKKRTEIEAGPTRYPAKRFRFLPSDEARRRYWFGLDTKDPRKVNLPDTKLLSAVVMEQLLMNWFWQPNFQFFENTAEADSWFRDIVAKFGKQEPEISDLWEFQRSARQGKSDLSSSDVLPQLRNVLAAKLREKGVAEQYIQKGLAAPLKTDVYVFTYGLHPNHKLQPSVV